MLHFLRNGPEKFYTSYSSFLIGFTLCYFPLETLYSKTNKSAKQSWK